jgi:hypothetical protein
MWQKRKIQRNWFLHNENNLAQSALTVQEFLVRNLVAVVPHLLHLSPM